MSLYPLLPKSEDEINEPSTSKMTSTTISLEIAEKMLSKFDGNKNKLYEFIDNCDLAIKLVKAEVKPVLFAIIKTKLTDNARAVSRTRDFCDWISLKNHLLDVYTDKRTLSQRQLELNSCKQNTGENVMSFANRIELCYINAMQSLDDALTNEAKNACVNLLKNEALQVFLSGLQKDLSLLVKSQKPDSLESAISIALQEEQEQKSKLEMYKFHNHSLSNNKFLNFRRNTNVNNFNTRPFTQKPDSRSFNSKPMDWDQQKFKNTPHQSVRKINQTYNASQPGPSNRVNNFPTVKICNYCKNRGHLIHECRKREYNNSKKNQNSNLIQREHEGTVTGNQNSNLNNTGSRRPTAESRGAHLIQAEFQQMSLQ